jgi:hypothetical protein
MNIFFTLEAYTDSCESCDGPSVKAICDASMDAILHPENPRPSGESVLGEIVRQLVPSSLWQSDDHFQLTFVNHRFWKRASLFAPDVCKERFVATWRTYVASIVVQAERHSSAYICTINEYMAARRDNIGTYPTFVLLEICLELDIPHEVMQHPAIDSLNRHATDMVFLTNVVNLTHSPILLILNIEYIGHVLLQERGPQ